MKTVEFVAYPEFDWRSGADTLTWTGKLSVNLRWVASARSVTLATSDLTQITLAGSPSVIGIDIPYSDFMAMWMQAQPA